MRELINDLKDKELIARCQSAIRDAQYLCAQSLEVIAENDELLKLVKKIESSIITSDKQ